MKRNKSEYITVFKSAFQNSLSICELLSCSQKEEGFYTERIKSNLKVSSEQSLILNMFDFVEPLW